MTIYAINIVPDYEAPPGPLDAEQYVDFVMNRAAQSYMIQYGCNTPDEGIQAACDAYNSSLPQPVAEVQPDEKKEGDAN